MAKTNYNHARRQREAARKARQEAKQARKQAARAGEAPAADADAGVGAEQPAAEPGTAAVVPE
ncbi:MAG: hypothetical protein ACYC0F_20430 [Rhodanobacter sp.]